LVLVGMIFTSLEMSSLEDVVKTVVIKTLEKTVEIERSCCEVAGVVCAECFGFVI